MKTFKISNCMDCPNSHVIPDPDPDDWFCDDDCAVICTKTINPNKKLGTRYIADRSDFRTITVACRPYRKRSECKIPDWCPL